MKTKKLLTLAAAAAALTVPLQPVMFAKEPVVQTGTPASSAEEKPLSADEFIDQYLGMKRIVKNGNRSEEVFEWFKSADQTNCALLSKSRDVFDKLDEKTQKAILAAAQAHQMDYEKLVQEANVLNTQMEAKKQAAAQAEKEKTAQQQPAAPADSPAQSEPQPSAQTQPDNIQPQAQTQPEVSGQVQSQPEMPVTPALQPEQPQSTEPADPEPAPTQPEDVQQGTDTQAPASAVQTDENQPEAAPVSINETSEQNLQPEMQAPVYAGMNTDGKAMPSLSKGMLSEVSASSDLSGLELQAAAAAAASQNMNDWQASRVVLALKQADQTIQSDQYLALKNTDRQILFKITDPAASPVNVELYNPTAYSWNFSAGLISFNETGQTQFEPRKENAPAAMEQPLQEAAENPSLETPVSNEAVSTETLQPEENIQQPVSTLPVQNPVTLPQLESQLSPADPVTDFIARYCTKNGRLMSEADQSSYQQILNGFADWHTLSAAQRDEINARLRAQGGSTYSFLYTQANQIRLGIPVTRPPQSSTTVPSVHTGVESEKDTAYVCTAGLMAFVIAALDKLRGIKRI